MQCLNIERGSSRTPYVTEWTFSIQYQFSKELVGRNILFTDHLINDDLSLSKLWKIREHSSVELRGEFFNLFNHPTFGYPDLFADDDPRVFGTVSSTLNSGLQVQMALKIHF